MNGFCEIRELILREPFGITRGTKNSVRNLFVRIEEGIGEGAPIYYLGQTADEMRQLTEEWFSSDPDLTKPISTIVEDLLRKYPGQTALAQAIDLALHDNWAKESGKPLYSLWGLAPQKAPLSSFTIGWDRVEIVLEKVRRAIDYPILKIKAGGENDLDMLARIRELTAKPLLVDANEGWTVEQTLDYLPRLHEMGIRLVEQPLSREDKSGYKRIYRENPTSIPIVADEGVQGPSDVERWVGLVQGVNVKLAKCGGLARAKETIRKARRNGLLVMLGCMVESSLGITAAAHLASLVDYVDLDGAELIANDPYDGMRLEYGRIIMPSRPGIGIVPQS